MADTDKEKAEKVAAAKKRYEELKKKKAKESKKGGASKKKDEDKAAAEERTEDAAPAEDAAVDDETAEDAADETSAAQQSKQRSESFRQGSRIEELEKENKASKEREQASAARLARVEEELEGLREGSGEVAELKRKAEEGESAKQELAGVKRELEQAKKDAVGKSGTRRQSAPSPELAQELERKTGMVESLELEISKLKNQASTHESAATAHEASIKEAEERVKTAEDATAAVRHELDSLKVSLSFPSHETQAASEDPEALTKRITLLESDLRTATNDLTAASQRATSLEAKIEALTTLHRDTNQHKDKELAALRSQLDRPRTSHVRDASDFELRDEETETGALQARIRALEAENFDLKRGVWRDKRAELQPVMHDDAAYEDVDLTVPAESRNGLARQTSTFQDVISSGISAFTGRTRESPVQNRPRNQSIGLLSEDGFDEEAFRLAQEEDAKRRIERVKEVKRGLDQWRGWRVDLVDLRHAGVGGGRECGPVFEV